MADSMNRNASGRSFALLDNRLMRFISNISMEIYLCHMMIFRVVKKLHFEKHIANRDLSFVVHFVLTFALAMTFAWFVKCVLFKNIAKKCPKLKFLG